MDSVNDLEEYVRGILGIPYINLNGLNLEVGKVVIKTIEEVFRNYPFLKHTLSAIGNREYITNYLNLNWYADFETWESLDSKKLECDALLVDNAFATLVGSYGIDEKNGSFLFCTLSLGDFIWSSSLENINLRIKENRECGNFHKYYNSMEPLIYHEMGHLLDFVLRMSDSEFFIDYYDKNYNLLKEQLSYTASLNKSDFFAEVFSYYHCGKTQNQLVKETMELVSCWTNNFQFPKKELENLNLVKKFRIR